MKSRITKPRSALPFVFLNVATTADGKIAPENRQFVPFSSKRDRDLMMELRATADAVMSGARTVDLYPASLGPGGKKYRDLRLKRGLAEYNLRVIASGSASVNPSAEIFKHRFSPVIVLTTEAATKSRVAKLRAVGAEVMAFGEKELDFAMAFRWLHKKWNVSRLLCEGGGAVNNALFRAGLVDEIHLTLCPVIFGGRNAPTMADGDGIKNLDDATRLEMKSMKRVGDELFLVYSVLK